MKIATRRFTIEELEKLQTLSAGYTEGVSDKARIKAIGNGWTVDVIVHILKSSLNTEPIKIRLGNVECEQLKWII